MTVKEKKEQVMHLQVTEDLTVSVIPNHHYEFLMDSKTLAIGYGVPTTNISSLKHLHKNELKEDLHYVVAKGIKNFDTLPNAQPHAIYWTKAGVIRLGFFIKSERAKLFRDWAEGVILEKLSSPTPLAQLPEAPKRKHNRLSAERLLDIMSDVCMIEDTALRLRLANKLKGGFSHV